MAALKKIRWLDIDFGQVEVYTYRELKNGSLSLSRPCESCLAFMKQLGIKRIYYTTPDGYAEERLIY
jgi:tRNA(Arg) A34 adenosine deaminase TadA